MAAAHQSKRSTNSVAAASAAYTTVTDNSSIISKIGTVARTKQAKTKKIDRKWICPKCQGDVRLPPPSVTTETNTPPIGDNGESINLKNCNGKINQEEESVKEALDLTTVMCALKCCPAPRYHLTCSGVPKGSQVFRNTIISCQTAANGAVAAKNSSVNTKCDAKHILEHLYSSSEGVWWDLPTDIKILIDGKKCSQKSQQSLRNDKDWPTSMVSFMCPSCDVEGTSRYLCEYFERFNSMKTSFYADYLSGSNNDGMGNRRDRAEESVETRTGEAFLWHLIKDNRKEYLNKTQTEGKPIHYGKDNVGNPSEIRLKNMARVLTFLSKQLQHQQMQQHQRRQKRQKDKFQLDPSYLVGMPIRLFNPIDNSYHSGRVLDYKVNAPYKVDQPVSNAKPSASSEAAAPGIGQLTDGKICSTLFLVRFRHGVEGRKIAVHQWIYLEEHAVTIGGEVCWAKVENHFEDAKAGGSNEKDSDHGKLKNAGSGTHVLKSDVKLQAQKKEYVSQYRPVQILFRSMLEMIPVQNLNPPISCTDNKKPSVRGEISMNESPCMNVLAMGFGQAFSHVRLSFDDSGMKTVKTRLAEVIETQRSIFDETATIAEPTTPVAIPLTSSNPSWIDQILRRAQLSDEDVALGLATACMEKEEERRVRTWRNLSVSHLSQPSPIKRNYKVSSVTAPAVASITRSKKRRTQCSTPSANSSSLSQRLDLYHETSLEDAASLGCGKCIKEFKTGSKTNKSHDEKCPRRRNFHTVSLTVAASFGCAKCIKELKTGSKVNSSHDEICPRRRNFTGDLLDEDDVKASISIQLSNAAEELPSPCLNHETRPLRKKPKVSSSMSPRADT